MQHHFLKNKRVKAEIHFKKLKIFVAWRKQMLLRDLVGLSFLFNELLYNFLSY